jgi:hypothetical protein
MSAKTLIHTVKYFLGYEAASTQVSESESNILSGLAKNAHKVLEIGVFEGHSTKLLAEAMNPSGTLYAVDPFFAGRLGISYGLLVTHQQIRKANKINPHLTIKLIKDFSYNLAKISVITLPKINH